MFVLLVFALWYLVLPPIARALGPAENFAPGIAKLGLAIACAWPAAFVAARVVRGTAWSLLSTASRLRRRWLALCVAVALVQVILSFGIGLGAQLLGHPLGPIRDAWVGWSAFWPLALAVVLVIPLQAAAEEFAFRGILMQSLGAWVRWPWFAAVLSAATFGLAHGLPPAGFVAITTFGLVAAWLTIATGGLEAALALHVVNNVTFFLVDAATGRGDRWVSELNEDIRWSATLVDVTLTLLYGVVIARLARRWCDRATVADPLAAAASRAR